MAFSDTQTDTFQGPFDIPVIREWLWNLRARFGHPSVDLALVFVSPSFTEHSGLLLSLIQDELSPTLVAGCTSISLISNAHEYENAKGFAIGLYHLPGTQLTSQTFSQADVQRGQSTNYWHELCDVAQPNGWIVFADPFKMNLEVWLRHWNQAFPGIPTLGGLASGTPDMNGTEIYLNDQVYSQGGVGIAFTGSVSIRSVISQGCTPIGDPGIVTKVSENRIAEIGNRRAYDVLLETVNNLPPTMAAQARGNLFLGLVIDEYHEDFHRGDFLVRNLLGADPDGGIVSVGALPRPGQTVQFQLRSPEAARQDLTTLLEAKHTTLKGEHIHGGLLCTCNGRGQRLFGTPNHDSGAVIDTFPDTGLVGFCCNGELGPVGDQNFLHGYTASLALFTSPRTPSQTPSPEQP